MLNVKALALTAGLLWGACLLLVAVLNLAFAGYGDAWLELASSIYPGYDGPSGPGSAVIVALYGLVDGAVCGALFGWLYNVFAPGGPAVE